MRLTSLCLVFAAILAAPQVAAAQRLPTSPASMPDGMVTVLPGTGFDAYAVGFERLVQQAHGLRGAVTPVERYEAIALRATREPPMALATSAVTLDDGAWAVSESDAGVSQVVPVEVSASVVAEVVPEPEVIILLASGLLALGAVAYFRGLGA